MSLSLWQVFQTYLTARIPAIDSLTMAWTSTFTTSYFQYASFFP